jgi:hypothetical protein
MLQRLQLKLIFRRRMSAAPINEGRDMDVGSHRDATVATLSTVKANPTIKKLKSFCITLPPLEKITVRIKNHLEGCMLDILHH